MSGRARYALLALFLFAPLPAQAVQPGEVMKDPALEHRAREISEGLRCLVCQNQSIDDSDAPLAKDLRLLVRDRLAKGDSNEAVRDYIVARYGEKPIDILDRVPAASRRHGAERIIVDGCPTAVSVANGAFVELNGLWFEPPFRNAGLRARCAPKIRPLLTHRHLHRCVMRAY